MDFHYPLLGLFGAIATVIWALDFWSWRKRSDIFVPSKIFIKNSGLRGIIFLMGLTGWLLLSFSMMGPRKSSSFSSGNIKVNDILFVLDVSRSMLAEDLSPNRLEVAKKKLQDFVKLRPRDRLGVIIFSEKVYTVLPLTTDPSLVTKVLGEINVGYLGSGTNIGDALGLGVARAESSETENKVVILLTDGVSNVGNMTPMAAAEEAKKHGIKVYTIGLGTDESARLPVGGGRYVMIPGGSIDMKTLKAISELTGGKSYHANSQGALEEILQEIETLEKTEIRAGQQIIFKELYYIYLLWGILLIFTGELLRRFLLRELA